MVRAFVLYYLNIKPTHGYEIQKFLQVQGTEQWGKIQSGSIYYALTKLEKEEHIEVYKEERTGSRVRKIYQITQSGRKELQTEMAHELSLPLAQIGSFKFMIDPILNTLSKEESIGIIDCHLDTLREQKEYWKKWQDIKASKDCLELNRISFELTISSLTYQIEWHEELLKNLDTYLSYTHYSKNLIQAFDFDTVEANLKDDNQLNDKLEYVMKLKSAILEDPRNAVENLDKLIDELKKGVK
jgi:DNA-binding PadR family transcriptional regulator